MRWPPGRATSSMGYSSGARGRGMGLYRWQHLSGRGARRAALMAARGGALDSRERGAGVLPFIGGRRWLRWCTVNPAARRSMARGTTASGVVGRQGSARAWQMASSGRPANACTCAAWSKVTGSGWRCGMGGPTVHELADGSRPRRQDPEGPTVGA
jgi:hypothetical protein